MSNYSTDHLYNPARSGVGNLYPEMDPISALELQMDFAEQHGKFVRYVNTCPLMEALSILIDAYKERYASTEIILIYSHDTKYYSGVDKRNDWKIDWHIERVKKHGLDLIEIRFKEEQQLQNLKATIEDALSGKTYQVTGNKYIIQKSPIDSIYFSTSNIRLQIHPDKVKHY